MLLYKLERTDEWSYDSYDSCIVAAEDEKDAITITPSKGITCRSRYIGVHIKVQGSGIRFVAKYGGKDNYKFLGSFPLTLDGELRAAVVYRKYLDSLPSNKYKGRIITNKKVYQWYSMRSNNLN